MPNQGPTIIILEGGLEFLLAFLRKLRANHPQITDELIAKTLRNPDLLEEAAAKAADALAKAATKPDPKHPPM